MPLRARTRPARRLVIVTAIIGCLANGAGHRSVAAPVGLASQPSQPRAGIPGANGHCGMDVSSVANPEYPAGPVWIFVPTGGAAATVAGGRCDDTKRPTVFLGHGFGQTDPAAYAELIEHFVSVGNVVVYPTYDVSDGDGDGDVDRYELEVSYRVADAGIVAAVSATSRIDTRRVGWWGHSHGGGMIPWLVQQGEGRGWGSRAIWMSMVAQAYSQLVGAGEIDVPARAQAMTVAFEHDEFADNRLGIDVFESLKLPPAQKRHVTVNTDLHGQPPFVANHGAPAAAESQADAVDFLLWRYADLLEICALSGTGCDADLSTVGDWSDGTPIIKALVSPHPVDFGPAPAILSECDAGFAAGHADPVDLNPRKERCGPTHM